MMARTKLASAAVVFALTGAWCAANAAPITLLQLEASTDGRTWSEAVRLPREGGRVLLRASVSFVTDDDSSPLGFAGLTWQPTISNWNERGDRLLPWADRGTNLTGGSVPNVLGSSGPFGRIIPFAATGPGTSDPYVGHSNQVRGSNYLRLARSSITNWVGEGATTGTNAFNNFNGSGGLSTWQKSWSNVTSVDPRFVSETRDLLILKLGIEVAPGEGRVLRFDAPLEGMTRNSLTGRREASWFANQADNFGQIKGNVVVRPATILVVPTAGTGVWLAVGVGIACRRRRESAARVGLVTPLSLRG